MKIYTYRLPHKNKTENDGNDTPQKMGIIKYNGNIHKGLYKNEAFIGRN